MSNPDDGFFEKRAYDEWEMVLHWAGKIPSGATISSGDVVAIDMSTNLPDSAVVNADSTIQGTDQKHYIKAGTPGKSYLLLWQIDCGANGKFEEAVVMKIKK